MRSSASRCARRAGWSCLCWPRGTLSAGFPRSTGGTERSGRRVGSSRSSGTIANSVATTRELSQRSEQLRVLLVHRTNIPPQFLASVTALAIAHGTSALPLLSQSAPKPPLMAGARLPCRRRHPRLVARPAPSAPARWPRAASAETAAQLLGGRSESRLPRHRHPTAPLVSATS